MDGMGGRMLKKGSQKEREREGKKAKRESDGEGDVHTKSHLLPWALKDAMFGVLDEGGRGR